MLRFAKAITATVLGLAISLSLFTPGVFAQSISQSTVNRATITQEANLAEEGGHGNSSYNSDPHNNGGANNDYNRYRGRHVRCVQTSRWVRTRYGARRVWYRTCRRY